MTARAVWAGALVLAATTLAAEDRITDIHEGTNIAVTVSPDRRTLVVDLIGQLWHVPLSGGAANPLTPATAVARNPRFSPDGSAIVYQGEDGTQWDLWLLDVASGVQRRLTETPYDETAPDFAADGRSVVFSSNLAGTYDIWELDLGSGELSQLTRGAGDAAFPSVSERGEIAYVDQERGRWSVKLLRDGVSRELVSRDHPLRAPTWRPGGGVIVFNEQPDPERSNLVMMLLDDEPVLKTLTRGEDVFGFRPAWLAPGEFVYTADGRVWRRGLASAARHPIHIFAGVAVTRPGYRRRTTELAGSPATPQPEPYVIQVDRLFDGVRNQFRRHMDVHVEGRRISAVVARGLRPLPERVIDARDATLIPGLIDLHAHPPDQTSERVGRAWLAYGITTVRELGADPEHWAAGAARRAAWSSQPEAGPRLLLTAPASSDPAGGPADVFQLYRGRPEQLTPGVMSRVRELGIPVFGQTLFPAARFGIDGLEHIGALGDRPYSLERSALDRSYQDVLGVLIETRTVVTPALVAFGGFQTLSAGDTTWSRDRAYLRLFSADERARWELATGSPARLEALQRLIARLVQAGGRIAAGSDTPAVPYGLGLHAELTLLSGAGIPNDQVLRVATAEAALALGVERDLGTIEVGKLADFVVLDGNPLARIQDTLTVRAVVKDGRWMDREALLAAP